MSTKLQPVRGTHDLIGEDARKYNHIVHTARGIAEQYGYSEIQTPMFEFSDVFHRTLGDTSDVVTKETYTFTDRGGESLTLRPEFTAAIARAFISNGLQQNLPCKFFYAGPAFRYERPQKGRMRQFHQIGVELLGVEGPLGDVESIAIGHHILNTLGITRFTLEINTLGDRESREAYRNALVAYFESHKANLSEDSKMRLEKNPLRILDSKDEGDKKFIAGAPQMHEYRSSLAKDFYAKVKEGLASLHIPFTENSRLVRGLDYYNHTVFEFTTDALGAQNTILAGGRYDGLIGMMGGADTPGVGWASGVERLMAMVDWTQPGFKSTPRPISVVPVSEAMESAALTLTQTLRNQGYVVDLGYKGNASKRLKKANSLNVIAAIVLGEEEMAKGEVLVKDLDSGEQTAVKLNNLVDALARFRQ